MQKIETSLHDKIVELLVEFLKGKGYSNIKADHIDYVNGAPKEIEGHVPDVTANTSEDDFVVAEVKVTQDDFSDDVRDQLKIFSENGDEFHMSVPKSISYFAEKTLERWDIDVDKWWYYND